MKIKHLQYKFLRGKSSVSYYSPFQQTLLRLVVLGMKYFPDVHSSA
jgi:hypothetical protein